MFNINKKRMIYAPPSIGNRQNGQSSPCYRAGGGTLAPHNVHLLMVVTKIIEHTHRRGQIKVKVGKFYKVEVPLGAVKVTTLSKLKNM